MVIRERTDKENYFELLQHSQIRGPGGGLCGANMHEMTRQTVRGDNHLGHLPSSCISKLKMGEIAQTQSRRLISFCGEVKELEGKGPSKNLRGQGFI